MKELDLLFREKKESFLKYLDRIKKGAPADIYTVTNVTLVSNPYISDFPKKFFLEQNESGNRILSFIKSASLFYLKQTLLYFSYIASFLIHRIFCPGTKAEPGGAVLIDIFFLVDRINEEGGFRENYFAGLYEVLEKYGQRYIFLPRLYGANRNPFKLIKLFRILRDDQREFLFEFELLSCGDLLRIAAMIALYPFKTLRLLQNSEPFDSCLIEDISDQSFEAFSRYVLGRNIARIGGMEKIYSWSEFQVTERAFNFGYKRYGGSAPIYAAQLFVHIPAELNIEVRDADAAQGSAPDIVLVNGGSDVLSRSSVVYKRGVSLRYANVFDCKCKADSISGKEKVLVLTPYFHKDASRVIELAVNIPGRKLLKLHPAADEKKVSGVSGRHYLRTGENIYELFKKTGVVVTTGSGTALEAVSCGVSVILISSIDNFTLNPLLEYGKGEIWDEVFTADEVEYVYNKLFNFRQNDPEKIAQIALWYRENCFTEPTEYNIMNAFGLGRG